METRPVQSGTVCCPVRPSSQPRLRWRVRWVVGGVVEEGRMAAEKRVAAAQTWKSQHPPTAARRQGTPEVWFGVTQHSARAGICGTPGQRDSAMPMKEPQRSHVQRMPVNWWWRWWKSRGEVRNAPEQPPAHSGTGAWERVGRGETCLPAALFPNMSREDEVRTHQTVRRWLVGEKNAQHGLLRPSRLKREGRSNRDCLREPPSFP